MFNGILLFVIQVSPILCAPKIYMQSTDLMYGIDKDPAIVDKLIEWIKRMFNPFRFIGRFT